MCAATQGDLKVALDPLELELESVMRCLISC